MIAAGKAAGARILLVGMRILPNYGQDYSEGFYAMYGKLAKSSEAAAGEFPARADRGQARDVPV